MGWRGNQVFDEIIVMDVHPLNTATTAILRLEFTGCQALNVTVVTQGNHDIFLLNQIFIFKTQHFTDQQFSPALVTEFLLNIEQFIINNLVNTFRFSQNIGVVGNGCLHIFILAFNLVTFQTGQPHQPHVQDGLTLLIGQIELVH